jgi:hypothetical protein
MHPQECGERKSFTTVGHLVEIGAFHAESLYKCIKKITDLGQLVLDNQLMFI